ncbi:MAG TPA: hypothetical protein VJN95_06275 [Gemmatimonadales bacterium]|nr:hypothetical protein [Gemmatimonadales bacterium]
MVRPTFDRSAIHRASGLFAAALLLLSSPLAAQAGPRIRPEGTDSSGKKRESPWLIVPTFSLNPKLGASFGALGAYMHYFDEKSRPSMFGLGGQYTTTKSAIASVFARASWDEDHQRLIALLVAGKIRNDYDDYLGTGQPLKTDDKLFAVVARYLYRVWGHWFIGPQGLYSNYQLLGESPTDDQILDVLGLKGFESAGLGISLYRDNRDNENSPHHGALVNVNNVAYRDWLVGDNNFDVYRVEIRAFIPNGKGHVLAIRQFNKLTSNAPPSAFAAIQLRGYKPGELLGEYMSSIEVEERFRLADRWTSTAFVGAAVLYGDSPTGGGFDNPYPDIGAGVQFVIKQKEGIVANAEAAFGKDGEYGIYIKLGYAY